MVDMKKNSGEETRLYWLFIWKSNFHSAMYYIGLSPETHKFQNILFLGSLFGVGVCDVSKSYMMFILQTQVAGEKIIG